ncbi:hypothetical protein [Hymenobacter persicinus]|uniref:DUF3300 domain-containing protein n=1 Tax=Hymenobacter persicinus TaxID=2025506 RepID=A0A4Q5LCR4_9BACT|nr:hypothetical protein [Hymenobacter persicinus]RYU81000.1 hypothetical protein EWM57_07095 [Hymenobacter persicinus]
MLKAITAAACLTVAALALSATPARAQININIGPPAPQYVVVREARPVKKWKGPKYRKGAVLLVPAGPAYYYDRGHGHGHGRGRGRH